MKEKYIKQIMKQLTCSKQRKKEIRKQLNADIEDALSAGEAFEKVRVRMGEPNEIANSLNQDFSEEEKKKYKRERRTRRILQILLVIAILIPIFWWVIPKNTWLKDSKIFDEKVVQEQAETAIALLDAGDYEGLKAMSDAKMAELLNEEEMEKAKDQLGEDWGSFQNFGSWYLMETTQGGIHMAVAQMNASYENTSVTYTVTFDENMKMNGLWMK